MVEKEDLRPVEESLSAYFRRSTPDAEFLAALEGRLSAGERIAARAPLRPVSFAWRYALVTAIVVLVVAVLAIGPDRVWAALQRWAGYLPGVGVVELEGARALPAPVRRTRDQVTVSVEQLLASTDQTIVVAEIAGVSLDSSAPPGQIRLAWEGGSVRGRAWMWDVLYEDCPDEGCPSSPAPIGYRVRAAFEPLPPAVNRVTVYWVPRAPTSGVGEWAFDLELRSVEDLAPGQWLVRSYSPTGVRASRFGIDVVVTRVFQDAQATVVEIQIEVPAGVSFPSFHDAALTSDRDGAVSSSWVPQIDLDLNPIPLVTTTPSLAGEPTRTIVLDRLVFAPGDPTAREWTLNLAGVTASYHSTFELPLPLGAAPSPGLVVPLDVAFVVDGFEIHIDEARVVEAEVFEFEPPEAAKRAPAIEFHVDSPIEQDGRRLREIWLSPQFNQNHADLYYDPLNGVVTERLGLDPVFTPTEPMIVRLERVVLDLQGPWVVKWQVPESR